MKIVRSTAVFVVSAALLLAMSTGQALATTVHCGDVITQDTTLENDLSCTGDGVTIGANDVTLNLNGHSIVGQGSGVGVLASAPVVPPYAQMRNIVVRDGLVKDFALGISMEHVNGAAIEHITAQDAGVACDYSFCTVEHDTLIGSQGRSPFGWGISIGHSDPPQLLSVVHDNRLEHASIFLGKASGSITDNVVEHAAGAGIEFYHGHSIAAHNTVRFNAGDGIAFGDGEGDVVDNTIYGNAGSGIGVGSRGSATITSNVVRANGEHGIAMPSLSGASISHNVISRNRLDGVHALHDPSFDLSPSPAVFDNHIDRNGGDGIRTDSPSANLTGNHTWFNGNLGIEAVPGTLGGGNWAKHNGNPLQCVPTTLCSTTGKPKR